jgi:hypothetical protein
MRLPHPDVHMYNLHLVCFHVSFCIIAPRPHSLPVCLRVAKLAGLGLGLGLSTPVVFVESVLVACMPVA